MILSGVKADVHLAAVATEEAPVAPAILPNWFLLLQIAQSEGNMNQHEEKKKKKLFSYFFTNVHQTEIWKPSVHFSPRSLSHW